MTTSRSRLIGLGLVAAGTAVVLARAALSPGLGKPRPYAFPAESISLPGWQFQTSQPLTVVAQESEYLYPALQAAQQYVYASTGEADETVGRDDPLGIEMYYLVLTDGQIQRYVREYHPEDIRSKEDVPPLDERQTEVGTHYLFTHGDRAYLSACINSYGPSTVTRDQFELNRNTHDLQVNRFWPVFWGREPIRDRRCLWVLMSLPADDDAQRDESFAQLEQVWPSWYAWWSNRFPAS